jgi:hypothetical protein
MPPSWMEDGAVGHYYESGGVRTILAKFGLHVTWFSGFRGDDLNVKVYNILRKDGRRTPSDGKSSHGIWPGELQSEHNFCLRLK